MKNARKEDLTKGKRTDVNMPKPENKDNLDSRERKEERGRENTSSPDRKEKNKRP